MTRAGELTDNEGGLVALIERKGPLTAYQIAKHYADSPIYTFNTAKGKLYPLLDRLIGRGLVSSEQVPNDRRGTKLYRCTDIGRRALRTWLNAFRGEHDLPPDPLRRKLQALDLLEPDEQLGWVQTARERLHRRLAEVEAFDGEEGPFGRLAKENARESLHGRLRWLDEIEAAIKGGTQSRRG